MFERPPTSEEITYLEKSKASATSAGTADDQASLATS